MDRAGQDAHGAAAAWTEATLANPHAVPDKAARVREMFAAIAPSYDLNNRLHSLGLDQHWRNVAVKMADVQPTDQIVDVACGTGDLTLKFARRVLSCCVPLGNESARYGQVLGIDFTYAMLPLATRKGQYALTNGWGDFLGNVSEAAIFLQGDALALPLPNRSADILSIAFGIRNVADWRAALREFARVLKPGGRLIILEFSLPKNALLRGLYNFYFRQILPRTATLISRDKTGAYKYLPESVNTFIKPEEMTAEMARTGFRDIVARRLTLGVCICYRGVKGPEGGVPA